MRRLLARLTCWWLGHECYSLQYADGRPPLAPPCQRCGAPNDHYLPSITDGQRTLG